MKKIGTAACVFLLVSAAPASAQQWSRTTTGIVTLSAGVGLVFAAFDFTFDVCPEGYSTHTYQNQPTQCLYVSPSPPFDTDVRDATTEATLSHPQARLDRHRRHSPGGGAACLAGQPRDAGYRRAGVAGAGRGSAAVRLVVRGARSSRVSRAPTVCRRWPAGVSGSGQIGCIGPRRRSPSGLDSETRACGRRRVLPPSTVATPPLSRSNQTA